MAPLPCSPVSNSTASEQSAQPSEDSDDSLTTPRPGPSDPAQRTVANLSQPSVPAQGLSADIEQSIKHFRPSPPGPHSTARLSQSPSHSRNPFTYHPSSHSPSIRSSNSSGEEAPQLQERVRATTFAPRSATFKSERVASVGWERMPESSSSSLPRSPLEDTTRARLQRTQDTESSADEGTGMVRAAQRRSASNYGATSGHASTSNDQAQEYDGAEEDRSGVTKRKSSLARSNRPSRSSTTKSSRPSEEPEEKDSWLRSLIDRYGSIELENKGSVARDHLALERTYLAWLRTSLAFASIGIAVTQLFRLNSSLADLPSDPSVASSHHSSAVDDARLRSVGKPLGATFLGISILVLLIGFHRFFESQHYVIKGKFPASRGSIVLVSLVAGALIVASLVVVLSIAHGAFET